MRRLFQRENEFEKCQLLLLGWSNNPCHFYFFSGDLEMTAILLAHGKNKNRLDYVTDTQRLNLSFIITIRIIILVIGSHCVALAGPELAV